MIQEQLTVELLPFGFSQYILNTVAGGEGWGGPGNGSSLSSTLMQLLTGLCVYMEATTARTGTPEVSIHHLHYGTCARRQKVWSTVTMAAAMSLFIYILRTMHNFVLQPNGVTLWTSRSKPLLGRCCTAECCRCVIKSSRGSLSRSCSCGGD